MIKYSDQLKNPKWQKKRLKILSRDKFTCKLCGDTETELHVHHKTYSDNEVWDYPDNLLITLCKDCHFEIECLREEISEIPIEDISIYKSNNWKNSNLRIMFISTPENCSMRIYDIDDYIIGFNFRGNNLEKIIRILKKSKNGKKIY